MRRFTRLTNAFSKKVQNHAAMVAIYAVHYNFARIHKALRITPAMACGLSDHVWNLEEIVMMADHYAPKPAPRGPYKKRIAESFAASYDESCDEIIMANGDRASCMPLV